MKEFFSILAIVVGYIAIAPYIWGIYKRTVKPHMFSWLIWSIVCGVGGTVQLAEGGGAGSWFLLVNSFSTGCIAVASCWLGTKDIKRSDWVILTIALSAIPIWILTDNPLWAVLISIGIDGIAYVPTIRKSWAKPYEESATSWGISVITFSLSIAALETYKLTTWLYPATFILINALLVMFLLLRRKAIDAGATP